MVRYIGFSGEFPFPVKFEWGPKYMLAPSPRPWGGHGTTPDHTLTGSSPFYSPANTITELTKRPRWDVAEARGRWRGKGVSNHPIVITYYAIAWFWLIRIHPNLVRVERWCNQFSGKGYRITCPTARAQVHGKGLVRGPPPHAVIQKLWIRSI